MEQEKSGAELLAHWVESTGRKQRWIANELGINDNLVSLWRLGRCLPTRKDAEALEKLSEGAVPAAAW